MEILNPATDEITQAINTNRCPSCGDGLSHDFVKKWLEDQHRIFARSRASNPHWYCLRRETDDQKIFEQVLRHLREFGTPYVWRAAAIFNL